ncbi:DUF3099 domain-containing protein [Mumia sp. DW29H23]|uniref:DUF3099 domain-containing protein n=1 Tax=Mumia sp. DW29H23 TaxID=3421241 RepID=UPI003D6826D3
MEGRKRRYLLLMGACLVLAATSWIVGSQVSVPAGIVLGVVAAALPPVAVTVANLGWEDRTHDEEDT